MQRKIFITIMGALVGVMLAAGAHAQNIESTTGRLVTSDQYFRVGISPDGTIAALTENVNGIQIVNIGTGSVIDTVSPGAVTITDSRAMQVSVHKRPTFTPDGTAVLFDYYIYDPERGSNYTTDEDGSSLSVNGLVDVIMAIDIETKEEWIVKEEAKTGRYSHNSRYLGYVHHDWRYETDPEAADHHQDLAIFDIVTGDTRYLTDFDDLEVIDFCFSPDDSKIVINALNRDSHTHYMYEIPVAGGDPVLMTDAGNGNAVIAPFDGPAWSPDGQWILYACDGSHHMQAYNTVTKTVTAVFPDMNDAIDTLNPVFITDGSKYACVVGGYENAINYGNFLFIYDFDPDMFGVSPRITLPQQPLVTDAGGKLVTVIPSNTMPATEKGNGLVPTPDEWKRYYGTYFLSSGQGMPVWSHDGSKIAFNASGALWVVSSAGGEPELLYYAEERYDYAEVPVYLQSSAYVFGFSPDDSEVWFARPVYDPERGADFHVNFKYDGSLGSCGGYIDTEDLWAINIETKELSFVLRDSGLWSTSSADGRYVAFKEEGLNILDTTTGDVRKLADDIGTVGGFAPDNSYVLASTREFESRGYKYFLDGRQPEEVPGLERANNMNVCTDGRHVIYDKYMSPGWDIRVLDMDTGKTGPFFTGTEFYSYENAALSPAGDKLAYVLRYENQSAHWTRIYVSDLSTTELGQPVAVEIDEPAAFVLSGNYPNPFNPTTTIEFTLPEAGMVNVDIFNLAGQKVRSLVSDFRTAGVQTVVWNGRDDHGLPASSGIYLSRVSVGGLVATHRMTLVK